MTNYLEANQDSNIIVFLYNDAVWNEYLLLGRILAFSPGVLV